MDRVERPTRTKQTPYSNDRVLVPDPEPNLEPFHVFQPQEKWCLGAEPHPSPLKSKRTVLKLLTNNMREQSAGESPHQVLFLKQQLLSLSRLMLNKTRSNKLTIIIYKAVYTGNAHSAQQQFIPNL